MSHQPHNIFAGTQVVVLLEVRGPNNSLVHPRGAVGVVTRTPAVPGEKYLVRFPDGFEASFEATQLEVLKRFKDRLGAPNSASARSLGAPVSDPARADSVGRAFSRAEERPPDSGFDLEDSIIYRCVVGSRAYGLDNEESDTDRRGIYLAPADLQWSLFGAPEQFEDNATQSCYWELQKFLTMALKANPNILECLYSPLAEKTTELGTELIAVRPHFLSQMIFQTFNGYAMSQFKKIEQDRRNHGKPRPPKVTHEPTPNPSREENFIAGTSSDTPLPGGAGGGSVRSEIRWKHAMHLLRLLLTGAATLRTGTVPVRVEAHRDRLLAIKRGELPWPEVDAWRKELHRDFEHALAETKLPERPDYEVANRFLIKARREASDLN